MFKGLIGLFANKEESSGKINFQGWQGQYRQIKSALIAYAAGDVKDDGFAALSREDSTELGAWMRSEGKLAYGRTDEFADLMEKQRQFHRTAAKIVAGIEKGEAVAAAKLIEQDLERDATRLIVALSKMERKANGL